MSNDDLDIRESILRLVRQSTSVIYNSESLQEPSNYSEYRTKFLECRKRYEQPPPPVRKQPFLPHWVKPEYDTDLPITYKKRGNKITDVRINLFKNGDGDNPEIGIRTESNQPGVTGRSRTVLNKDLGINEGCKLSDKLHPQNTNKSFISNGEETNSSEIKAAFHSIVGNSPGTSDKTTKRQMNRHSRSMQSIKRFRSLRIIEERSSSMSFEINNTLTSNRIVECTPKKNPSILPSDSVITPKPIVCRPIVRKAIKLKKYDHIVTNVINRDKK